MLSDQDGFGISASADALIPEPRDERDCMLTAGVRARFYRSPRTGKPTSVPVCGRLESLPLPGPRSDFAAVNAPAPVSYLPQSDLRVARYALSHHHLTGTNWSKNRQFVRPSASAV